MTDMRWNVLLFCLICTAPLCAETVLVAPESGVERQDTTSAEENEAHGIIPVGGLTVSTRPITPISIVPEKKPYDQALEELALAQELLSKKNFEAASDVGLQAYDDLMAIHLPRRDRKRSQQIRLDRRRAATVYIDASIAYLKEFVRNQGGTEAAYKEGRLRLADLRDVAQNYPELTKKLHATMDLFIEAGRPAPVAPEVVPSTRTP